MNSFFKYLTFMSMFLFVIYYILLVKSPWVGICSVILKAFLHVFLCLLVTEKYMEAEVGGQKEMMDVLGNTVMSMLNKYWIYICGGMFFFVSFEGRIVMYKIIYMMMFLFCVALYQVCWWHILLMYFHFRSRDFIWQIKSALVLLT